MTSPDDTSFGGYISRFVGDLPVQSSFVAEVIVDPEFPKDQIKIVDLNSIEWAWLREMTDKDATPQGADFVARRVIGEATLRIRNGKKSIGTALGLDV